MRTISKRCSGTSIDTNQSYFVQYGDGKKATLFDRTAVFAGDYNVSLDRFAGFIDTSKRMNEIGARA